MHYDFDKVIDRRGTDSAKWDRNTALFGTEDVLDMWVADMDFPSPQPVIDAMRKRLEHPIFGYTFPSDSLYQAVIDRMDRLFGWQVEREWIIFVPGVITALHAVIDALTVRGDEVILQPPVYYPFFSTVKSKGCHVVNNQLLYDGERYGMDLEGFPELFATSQRFPRISHRIRALVLCSPHNPVGRVWTRGELESLAELCISNDCAIISDEIHCDLVVGDVEHTVTASISPEIAEHTITLMAPSKTFNLPGLGASFAIVPNPQWRRLFRQAQIGQGGVNIMGLIAMEAALSEGDDYVRELNEYLRGNIELFSERLAHIPGVKVVQPEGTYLAWVDMRDLGMDDSQLKDFMIRKARIATDFGYVFGPGGEGFQRFNLACPRSVVEEAVNRLEAALGV